MSIRIIVLDDNKREIIAIGDKRSTFVKSTPEGNLFDFQHLNDNSTKLFQINEDCYYASGTVSYIQKKVLPQLLAAKNLKPSELIKHAQGINRIVYPRWGDLPMDIITLFGRYDDGRLFEWIAERDGSEFLKFVEPGGYHVGLMGGSVGTEPKVAAYLYTLLQNKTPFQEALEKSILFASQVDAHQTISPTFDLIIRRF
jgi:hypothetical protein